MQTLEELRKEIDSIDETILKLLSSRFQLTRKIGELKSLGEWPVQDLEREEQLFDRLNHLASELNVPSHLVLLIYRNIIDTVLHEHRQSRAERTSPGFE